MCRGVPYRRQRGIVESEPATSAALRFEVEPIKSTGEAQPGFGAAGRLGGAIPRPDDCQIRSGRFRRSTPGGQCDCGQALRANERQAAGLDRRPVIPSARQFVLRLREAADLRWWLNRHRCNRDVSMHSVAPTGRHLGDNSLRISEIRLLSSAILKGFGRTGLSKAPLLRNASAYPVMSKVLIPG